MSQLVPFSNATEFTSWQANNCNICKSYESESSSYEEANCPAAYDIDFGSVFGTIRRKTADDVGFEEIREPYVRFKRKCNMFKK